MDFKEEYARILNDSWQLVVEPKKFWVSKKENAGTLDVFKSYYLPLSVVVGLCIFLGEIITSSEFLFSYAAIKSLRELIVYIVQFYGSVYVTNELISGFKGQKDNEMVKQLVAYSLFPFIVASIITGLIPGLYALSIIGLYSIVLFVLGVRECLVLPEEYKVRYILITILVNFLIFALLNVISWKLLQFFYAYGA